MSLFEKTIQDSYDDNITVEGVNTAIWTEGRVYLTISDGDEQAQAALSIKQAKKVRKALKKAIRTAEATR